MKSEEIRKVAIEGAPVEVAATQAFFLREIAAQLAEANELSRASDPQWEKLVSRINKLLDMAMQYAMNQMGIKFN